MSDAWMTFSSLQALPGLAHAFTLRHPEIEVAVDRKEALRRLTTWHHEIVTELGFVPSQLATADQVHGNKVGVVSKTTVSPTMATDALVCGESGIMLGIYVADCCAVYFVDPVRRAIGIAHAGRKGAELNITGETIATMRELYGTRPEDLVVQLSPCIRPPVFEVDFASWIREQALSSGVRSEHLHDSSVCTSSDPQKFYSYRMEKGHTGRMLALLGWKT